MNTCTIHIIQYEPVRAPEKPFVSFDQQKAHTKLQEYLIGQGYRGKEPEETADEYFESYQGTFDTLSPDTLPPEIEKLNMDKKVSWWKIEVNLETLRPSLETFGYFIQNPWSFKDLRARALAKFNYHLSDDDCQTILDQRRSAFDTEAGINWQTMDLALMAYLNISQVWILRDEVLNEKYRKIDDYSYEFSSDHRLGKTIDIRAYNEDDIARHIKTFGYASVDYIRNIYGELTNMIIAECIFHANPEIDNEEE